MTKSEAFALLEEADSILERIRSAFPQCDEEADEAQRRLEDVWDAIDEEDLA